MNKVIVPIAILSIITIIANINKINKVENDLTFDLFIEYYLHIPLIVLIICSILFISNIINKKRLKNS